VVKVGNNNYDDFNDITQVLARLKTKGARPEAYDYIYSYVN
jgi:hypothetical protein